MKKEELVKFHDAEHGFVCDSCGKSILDEYASISIENDTKDKFGDYVLDRLDYQNNCLSGNDIHEHSLAELGYVRCSECTANHELEISGDFKEVEVAITLRGTIKFNVPKDIKFKELNEMSIDKAKKIASQEDLELSEYEIL